MNRASHLAQWLLMAVSVYMLPGCRMAGLSARGAEALALSPADAILAPGNSLQLAATGGIAPYTYEVSPSPVAGSIDSHTGLYVAPATSTRDLVIVKDSVGKTATAEIAVTEAMSLSPGSTTLLTGQSVSLAPLGGVGPFAYHIVSGAGALTEEGLFTPPWAPDTSLIEAVDSLGNRATATLTREAGALQGGTTGREVVAGGGVDTDGNIYIAGSTRGTLPGQSALGNYDAFIVKYDPSGTLLWAKQFGSSSYDRISSLALDAEGNVFVVGETSSSFDGNAHIGATDAFLYACDGNGETIFSIQFGTASTDIATAVAVDSANGAVYVAGYTHGSLQGANAGGSDIFLRRYTNAGAHSWTLQSGTAQWDQARSLAVDASGYVYLGGYVGANTLGPGSFNGVAYPQSVTPAFIVKHTSAGAVLWTQLPNMAGEHPYYTQSLVADRNGALYAAFQDNDGLINANYGVAVAKLEAHDGSLDWLSVPSQNYSGSSGVTASLSLDASNNPVLVSSSSSHDNTSGLTYHQATVSKFDTQTGNQAWIRSLGAGGSTTIGTVSAQSPDGRMVFAMGHTNTGLDGFTNLGELDWFLAKFDDKGDKQ